MRAGFSGRLSVRPQHLGHLWLAVLLGELYQGHAGDLGIQIQTFSYHAGLSRPLRSTKEGGFELWA